MAEIEDVEAGESSFLRAIFETTPECIKVIAPDGTLLQVNPAGRKMIEAAPDDTVEGGSIYRFIAPEFHEMWKTHHEHVCRGEKRNWEFDLIGLGGTRRHMETHAVPLRMPGGITVQLAITRDITQRKEDDRYRQETEHRYRQLLAALPAPLYTTDLEGRITFFNEAAVAFAGRRPEIGEKWCVTWRLYNLDGTPLPHDQCPMAVALKEHRPIRGIEAVAERPDGTRIRFLPYPTPLYDTSGQPIGAINLLMDMTEKYRVEALSARLASIVESSDDVIISASLDGEIVTWNRGAERIFGYEAREIIGQPLARIIPPELQGEEKKIFSRIRMGERVEHYETVRLAKDGRRVHVSLTVSPLRDQFGKVIGASKVARDVTSRKEAEELQRLLVDELNHRVKNTLAIIQSIASMSLRHAKNSKDFVDAFSGRLRALASAHGLLMQTELQGAELTELIREQVLLGGAGDERITCLGPKILLDPQMTVHMALVLHELATNARKYGALSTPKGCLSIAWEVRSNGQRSLSLQWVERNGPKVDAPRARGFGSTLIEKTLRGHGGAASVRYVAEGLVCEITLPLPDHLRRNVGGSAAGKDAYERPKASDEQMGLKGMRIIIIEDEPLVSMDMEAILAAAGCEIVGSAATFERAKALIEQADCNAALLDANLSGDAVDELAAKLTERDISFSFVTGYERTALPQGFRDAIFLKKPFSGDELIRVVGALVHRPADVVKLRRKDHR